MTPAAGLFLLALWSLQPGPAAQPQPRRGEVDVQVTGCVSGDTLTETNLNRTSSSEGLNPSRRWRLRLTSEQREQLRKVRDKQVEMIGVANEAELKSARVVKSVPAGRGRVYVGADSSRTASREQPIPPTLTVGRFTVKTEACR